MKIKSVITWSMETAGRCAEAVSSRFRNGGRLSGMIFQAVCQEAENINFLNHSLYQYLAFMMHFLYTNLFLFIKIKGKHVSCLQVMVLQITGKLIFSFQMLCCAAPNL